MRRVATYLSILLLCGCSVGSGEGFVGGALSILDCEDGQSLTVTDFDLAPGFYAADPVTDDDRPPGARQPRLQIRIQSSSQGIEYSDGVDFLFPDVVAAARLFAAGTPLPVEDQRVCDQICASQGAVVRGQLRLYTTCRDSRAALTASAVPLVEELPPRPGSPSCLRPAAAPGPACPATVDRAALDALCQGDAGDTTRAADIERLLGGGSCLYLCQWGRASPSQREEDLDRFAIDFGDTIAALFSLRLVDARSMLLGECAAGWGQITGMFRFTVARGRVAQAFP